MVKKILIVEDNQDNLKLLNDLFCQQGYLTINVTNGNDALDIVRNKNLDLVLMDIQIPGMDGYTVIKEIKKDPKIKHIPVIAVTAYAMKGDREKGLKSGFDEYMCKPINIKEMSEMVKKFV